MMKQSLSTIDSSQSAADIVRSDYRAADIFKSYGIEFCCGVKWPLKFVCENRGIELPKIMNDLHLATRDIRISPLLSFQDWRIDFLVEYIINVHHRYLERVFPIVEDQLEKFIEEHLRKYPSLDEVRSEFRTLRRLMLPHLKQEEEIIFPYVQQIAHAYESKESYAGLLVRTLRKPVEDLMHHEHDALENILSRLRRLTDSYTPPPAACTSHIVTFKYLKELDDDLVQHLYLETSVLFPRAIAMEKELLAHNG